MYDPVTSPRKSETCSVGEQALELDSLYYSHLPQYRPVLDSSHSLELSYNFEEGPGTKEMPFSRFPSSPFNQQGSFFQCDDSISMLGTSQSSYNGFEDSCIESLQSSSIRSSMVSQSDVFNPLPIAKPYLRTRYSYMEGSSSTRRRLDADTTVTHSWHETDLPRDEVHPLPPGENNPNAVPGGKLCFEYMNKGRCQRMETGRICRFRHLVPNHPEAIADRYRSGLLSQEEILKYKLRECDPYETNPFAPRDAKICFEFLNRRICSRNQDMKICRFRHLLPEHPDAIQDRLRTMGEKLNVNCVAK